jgi:hypothetical protein
VLSQPRTAYAKEQPCREWREAQESRVQARMAEYAELVRAAEEDMKHIGGKIIRPIIVNGVWYPSTVEAMRVTGISDQVLRDVARGWTERAGVSAQWA